MNRLPPESAISSAAPSDLAARILDALPQTQCTRCGYPDCAGYAQAIAAGEAHINQCPPGGDAGIHVLASMTGRAYQPLDPSFGIEAPRARALIDESRCIGCTLCIAACPVDAIVGGIKRMHTVIAEECTGCELCLPPCPVDCIDMKIVMPQQPWSSKDAQAARTRYARHQSRLALEAQTQAPAAPNASALSSVLERAQARAQARLSEREAARSKK